MDLSVYEAAKFGRVGEATTRLLSQKTPNHNNILHLAAEFKQISFFKNIASSSDEGKQLVWEINKMGDTPLHIAAKVGCDELVDFLINTAKLLTDVQRAGDEEMGPIYAGSYKNLLRKTNYKKHTALHVAVQYGHHGVVMSLMKADPELLCSTNSAVESPLFLATCKGFSKIAAEILKVETKYLSFQGINGFTALHTAVGHTYQGAEGIVEIMVSRSPDMIKETDAIGWTPLHYAAFCGNLKAITLFMNTDKSSTSYISDNHGMTALHVATYKGHIEVMKELIRFHPDTCECLNAKNQTILHIAILGAQSDAVKEILKLPELPRLIDQTDEDGCTPMQLAVMGQNHEITEMLKVACGVDNTYIDKGFSLVFDNFLGEDIEIQDMSTENSHQGHSFQFFGVLSFQEQISRDFKFESHRDNKMSGQISRDLKKFDGDDKNSGTLPAGTSGINQLIAILVITITFTAAFAPPGGYGDDGKANLQDDPIFKWFQTFNMISFVLSFLVLLIEYLAAYLKKFGLNFSMSKLFHPEDLILATLFGMIVTFLMGYYSWMMEQHLSIQAILVIIGFTWSPIFLNLICKTRKVPA